MDTKRMIESGAGGNRKAGNRRVTVAMLCILAGILLLTDPQAAPTIAQDSGMNAVDMTPLPPPDDEGNPTDADATDADATDDSGDPLEPIIFGSDDDVDDSDVEDPPVIEDDTAPAVKSDERRTAYIVHIKQPITAATASRVKRFCERALQRARSEDRTPLLVFQFEVPEGQEELAQGSQFGICLDLADYISGPATADATTVAYIPNGVVGHAVLVAAACDEIFMAGEATIGPIGIERTTITPSMEAAYTDIPSRRKNIVPQIVLWLLDPTRATVYLKTGKGTRIALVSDIDQINQTETVIETTPIEQLTGADPGIIIGDAAVGPIEVATYKTAGPADLIRGLNIEPVNIVSDPSLSGDVRPVLVSLQGPIQLGSSTRTIQALRKKIDEDDANLVIVWIDSNGGMPEETMAIANEIGALGPDIMTVAYVPGEALSNAALIALACDDLIVTDDTRIGGSGAIALDDDQILHYRDALTGPDNAWNHRSWSLIAAMIDPDLTVYRCTRGEDVAFFSDQELEEYAAAHPNEQPWQRGMPVTLEGREFRCDGEEAVEFALAREMVGGFEEMKQLYGVEGEPGLVEPAWHDMLIRALGSPALAGLLLTIGMVSLYAELHMPGIGFGGFIAAMCFLLFFWSRHLGGSAGWLEVILFVTGVVFLLMEVLVIPGFGIFGFGGGALILVSVFLATQTFDGWPRNEYQFAQLQRTIWMFGGVALAGGTLIYFLNRWLPESTLFKGNLILEAQGGSEQEIREREAGDRYADLVGHEGTTTTQLTPSGKAQIDNQLLSVITDGVLVPKSTPVRVIAVQGNRIFVEPTVPLDEDV